MRMRGGTMMMTIGGIVPGMAVVPGMVVVIHTEVMATHMEDMECHTADTAIHMVVILMAGGMRRLTEVMLIHMQLCSSLSQ